MRSNVRRTLLSFSTKAYICFVSSALHPLHDFVNFSLMENADKTNYSTSLLKKNLELDYMNEKGLKGPGIISKF